MCTWRRCTRVTSAGTPSSGACLQLLSSEVLLLVKQMILSLSCGHKHVLIVHMSALHEPVRWCMPCAAAP